jgi:hypothetical protein
MNRGDCWASIPRQLVPVKWQSKFLAFWCRKFEDLQINGKENMYAIPTPAFIAKPKNPVINKFTKPQFRAGVLYSHVYILSYCRPLRLKVKPLFKNLNTHR